MPYADKADPRAIASSRAASAKYNKKKQLEKFGNLDDHRGQHGQHATSAQHPKWNEEGRTFSNGYVKVRVGLEHPLADAQGYAPEHLIVWVSAGRRVPVVGEDLHHKNENKSDNRIENIELLSKVEHGKIAISKLQRDGRGRLLPANKERL